MPIPVTVRRGSGAPHLAVKRGTRYITACGSVLVGADVQLLPKIKWQQAKRPCRECREIADAATSLPMLHKIACW